MLMAFGALALEPHDSRGWDRFWRRFKSHNPKYANAVMMMDAFVPEADVSDFLESMDRLVSGSLAQKMAGLYVDIGDDGTATSPGEAFDEELARAMVTSISIVIRTHASVWEGRDLTRYFVENAEQMRRLGRREEGAIAELLERLEALDSTP